jgi:hypothetical protein
MFLGQRNKYERPNYSGVRTIQLRSIVDGHTRTFVDDGPFETTRDWHTLPPNGQRQQLIRYVQKRCPGDDSLPLYFADSPQPDLYHPMIGKISIPVVNDTIRAKMAEFAPYMAERQQRGIEAVKSAKAAEEYKAQAQAAAMESALKNALADIVAAPAAPKRGRPAKGEESPSE